jgi:hypothetical protein
VTVSIARGVSAEIPRRVIGMTIDGGGTAITTGTKGYITVPYKAKIVEWSLLANTAGSAVVDVWKTTYPNIPVSGNSITGTDKPTLSSAQLNRNLQITNWSDVTINQDDVLGFSLDSVDGVLTSLTLLLQVA